MNSHSITTRATRRTITLLLSSTSDFVGRGVLPGLDHDHDHDHDPLDDLDTNAAPDEWGAID